jgi:hypothetical protein
MRRARLSAERRTRGREANLLGRHFGGVRFLFPFLASPILIESDGKCTEFDGHNSILPLQGGLDPYKSTILTITFDSSVLGVDRGSEPKARVSACGRVSARLKG